MVGNGNYEVSFTKIGRKWYCNVPGFPKELFEHTLMVGGASNYLEYYSRGENEIVLFQSADSTVGVALVLLHYKVDERPALTSSVVTP